MVADRFSLTDDMTDAIKSFSCNELVNFGDDYDYDYSGLLRLS